MAVANVWAFFPLIFTVLKSKLRAEKWLLRTHRVATVILACGSPPRLTCTTHHSLPVAPVYKTNAPFAASWSGKRRVHCCLELILQHNGFKATSEIIAFHIQAIGVARSWSCHGKTDSSKDDSIQPVSLVYNYSLHNLKAFLSRFSAWNDGSKTQRRCSRSCSQTERDIRDIPPIHASPASPTGRAHVKHPIQVLRIGKFIESPFGCMFCFRNELLWNKYD